MSKTNLRISAKLPILTSAIALIGILITASVAYYLQAQELEREAIEKLDTLHNNRSTLLASYLGTVETDLKLLATSPSVVLALQDFQRGYQGFGGTAEQTLQSLYISGNPYKAGDREKMDDPKDGSAYTKSHIEWHPWLRSIQETQGYYDIFLIDAQGTVVYTVFKELDFATNVLSGKWKDSDLGAVFRKIVANPKAGTVQFVDFAPYAPSNDEPASFIGTPIVDSNGTFRGALVYQMPIGRINGVLLSEKGLDSSGEIMVVGKDLLMRNQARFIKDNTILKEKRDTQSVRDALAGRDGSRMEQKADGTDVLSVYGPFTYQSVTYAMVAQINADEVFAPVRAARNSLFLIGAVIAVAGLIVSVLFSKTITVPLGRMTAAMDGLAQGNLSTPIPATERKDEIGDMAQAMMIFRDNMAEVERLKQEEEANKKQAEQQRRALGAATGGFV